MASWSLVLAGGDGVRLQAVTRLLTGRPIPKQYCRILGDRTLIEATLDRVALLFPPSRTLAVVNAAHLELARQQLRVLPKKNLVVQSANRDTGPGVLLGLLAIARRDSNAMVTLFPSDHYVGDAVGFMLHVRRLHALVQRLPERLAVLGIRPDTVDPEYGYVVPSVGVPIDGLQPAFEVSGFREKPSLPDAARIVEAGGLWNAFVMSFRVARVLELLEEVVGAPVAALRGLVERDEVSPESYARVPAWNFSHDFLAKVPHALVVARADDVAWNDWGTPGAIARTCRLLGIEPPWCAPPANVA